MFFNKEQNVQTDQGKKLKGFLQGHRPPTPPASPTLETRLFATINRTPQEQGFWPQPSWPWLTAGLVTIAVVVGAGIQGQQLQTAQEPDLEVLEAFLQETWVGTVEADYVPTDLTMQDSLSSPGQEWWLLTDRQP